MPPPKTTTVASYLSKVPVNFNGDFINPIKCFTVQNSFIALLFIVIAPFPLYNLTVAIALFLFPSAQSRDLLYDDPATLLPLRPCPCKI